MKQTSSCYSLPICIFLVLVPSFGWSSSFCSQILSSGTPLEGVRQVKFGRITAGEAVKIRFDPEPNFQCEKVFAKESTCRKTIKPGTIAVELNRQSGWVCLAFAGKHVLETDQGWVPLTRWKGGEVPTQPAIQSWAGVWQNESARLNITEQNGRVAVDGHAIWPGPHTTRFGEVQFEGIPNEGILSNALTEVDSQVEPRGCLIHLRRLGEFIFAQDNAHCGATNVHFSGLYRFRARLKP
jgi:hypothetical protein